MAFKWRYWCIICGFSCSRTRLHQHRHEPNFPRTYSNWKEFLELCELYFRLADVREDSRRFLLLVPFVPLFALHLLSFPLSQLVDFLHHQILIPYYGGQDLPQVFQIHTQERHRALRERLGQCHPMLRPLLLPLLLLFLLDCLLFLVVDAIFWSLGMILVPFGWCFKGVSNTAFSLFPRYQRDVFQRSCCQCLTRHDCQARFSQSFSFAQQACGQCKSRDRHWMWVRCASGRGDDAGEWKRVARESGELLRAPSDPSDTSPAQTSLQHMRTLSALEMPKHITGTDLPPWAVQLTSLTRLSLAACRSLKALPLQDILRLPSLTDLTCTQCPQLWTIPEEVCAQGGQATMQFLRQIQFNRYQMNLDMGLFLIGDGEAGKTSVVMALRSDQHRAFHIRADHRTVGIDISHWQPAGAGIDFAVYDLAGQAVYAKTHHIFLLRRAVYLFVWRPGTAGVDHLHDTIKRWLECLQLRIPGAFVMLVVTHIDQVPLTTLDSECKQVKHAVHAYLTATRETATEGMGLVSVFEDGESLRVNCLNGDGVAELRDKIVGVAKSMPWFGQLLPPSWVELQKQLKLKQLQRKPDGTPVCWLTWSEYEQVALSAPCNIERNMLASPTTFLHDTGVIRFFGDPKRMGAAASDGLQNTVYISPSWIMNVIKGLIRHDRQALIDFFVRQQDKRMLLLTNRLNMCGALHKDLVPFLWPSSPESEAFWAFVKQTGKRDDELWQHSLISSTEESKLATALLEGFDLLIARNNEYLAPGVLPPVRIPAVPFVKECPFQVTMLWTIVEMGSAYGIFSTPQDEILQILSLQASKPAACSSLTNPFKCCIRASTTSIGSDELVVARSSSEKLLEKVREEVETMGKRFAGLVLLGLQTRSQKLRPGDRRLPIVWDRGIVNFKGQTDMIPCGQILPNGKACTHFFNREVCLSEWKQHRAVNPDIRMGKIQCHQCNHKHVLLELLTTFRIPEMLQCPCCAHFQVGKGKVGSFHAGECRLKPIALDPDKRKDSKVTCSACLAQGRLGQIRILDIISPDVFVSGLSTAPQHMQELVSGLLRRIEEEADVVVGNLSGENAVQSGMTASKIVLVLLSNAYVASQEANRDIAAAISSCKPLIPVLMPTSSYGWSGPQSTSEQYWSHAVTLSAHAGVSAQQVDWSFFSQFAPLQFPGEDQGQAVMSDLARGVARCVRSRLQRPGRLDVYSDFSMLGVRLSFFDEFVGKSGGVNALQSLSTAQVMEKYVKPATLESKLSYCEYLVAEASWGSGFVANAEWFFSHTWKYLFLDVVDAAKQHFKKLEVKDPVLWFDVFSVSQHKAEARPFEWWSSIFLNSVGSIGKVLMLVQPFDDPRTKTPAWVTLSRVWCVFEIYASEATLSRFDVMMTQDMSAKFLAAFAEQPCKPDQRGLC